MDREQSWLDQTLVPPAGEYRNAVAACGVQYRMKLRGHIEFVIECEKDANRRRIPIADHADSPILKYYPHGDATEDNSVRQMWADEFAKLFNAHSDFVYMVIDFDRPDADNMSRWIIAKAEELRCGLRVHSLAEIWEDRREFSPWYCLHGRGLFDFRSFDRVPNQCHYLDDYVKHADDEFREFVESKGWTGLTFHPVPKQGRFESRLWHRIEVQHPLGRGVDHPLIDLSILEERDRQFLSPVPRQGRYRCYLNALRPERIAEWPALERMVRLTKDKHGLFYSPRRFLSRAVPPTDFAHAWFDRHWALCAQERVADELAKAGFVSISQNTSMQIVDVPPAGCADLDASGVPVPIPRIPPVNHEDEASPAPLRRATTVEEVLTSGLELVKRAKATYPRMKIGVEANEYSKTVADFHSLTLPETWLRLCKVLPYFVKSGADDFELVTEGFVREVPNYWNDQLVEDPSGMLQIGVTGCGDEYFLDTRWHTMPADCRVLLWNHETGEVSREWDCVPAFVQELILWANDKLDKIDKK